jgi:hypothetical protein
VRCAYRIGGLLRLHAFAVSPILNVNEDKVGDMRTRATDHSVELQQRLREAERMPAPAIPASAINERLTALDASLRQIARAAEAHVALEGKPPRSLRAPANHTRTADSSLADMQYHHITRAGVGACLGRPDSAFSVGYDLGMTTARDHWARVSLRIFHLLALVAPGVGMEPNRTPQWLSANRLEPNQALRILGLSAPAAALLYRALHASDPSVVRHGTPADKLEQGELVVTLVQKARGGVPPNAVEAELLTWLEERASEVHDRVTQHTSTRAGVTPR